MEIHNIETAKVEAIKTYLQNEFPTANVELEISRGPIIVDDPLFHVILKDYELTLKVTKECIRYHDRESSNEMIQRMEKDEIPTLLKENIGSVIVFYSIGKSPPRWEILPPQ